MATAKADTISTEKVQAPQNSKELFTSDKISQEQAPIKKEKRDSRIFLLSNDKRQGNVIIDLEEEVYDPKTKKTRAMRLLRRAPSIWLDEQPASNFTAPYVAKNTLTVTFQQGRAIIPLHETAKLEAMELSNRNLGNTNRVGAKDFYFKEWNPEEENKRVIAEEDMVIKAMGLAMTAETSDMVQHAAYLNIESFDEQGIQFDESALRAAYIRFAKNKSQKFLDSVHSPSVKIGYLIRNAFNAGKIDLSSKQGAAYWQDGGFICTLPEGRDAIEYLIEYAQTFGDTNTAFKNQLEQNTSS